MQVRRWALLGSCLALPHNTIALLQPAHERGAAAAGGGHSPHDGHSQRAVAVPGAPGGAASVQKGGVSCACRSTAVSPGRMRAPHRCCDTHAECACNCMMPLLRWTSAEFSFPAPSFRRCRSSSRLTAMRSSRSWLPPRLLWRRGGHPLPALTRWAQPVWPRELALGGAHFACPGGLRCVLCPLSLPTAPQPGKAGRHPCPACHHTVWPACHHAVWPTAAMPCTYARV